jgi:plastocyanin
MRNRLNSIPKQVASLAVVILMTGGATSALSAKEWQAWVGAQSRDLGGQALAYLPNELWVHTNDSIRWTLSSTEIHTVSFLKPGQIRPPNFGPVFGVPVGCGVPENTPDGASFDGSVCVNSGIMGQDGNIGTGLQPTACASPLPAISNSNA